MSNFSKSANYYMQGPSREEWGLKMKREIGQRWQTLTQNLNILKDGGTLLGDMTLDQVIETLNRGPQE